MKPRSVLLLDTQPLTYNHYITLAVADALRRHAGVGRVVLAAHGEAIGRFRDEGLDTFVAFGGSETHTDMLARLCGMAELSILWTTEDPYQLAGNLRTSRCFDIVFSNDKASVPAYDGRAFHLPLAASPLFQDHPVQDADSRYLYDLLFIGTAWPNRVRSLNTILAGAAPGLKVKLALPWNEFIGPPDLLDEDLIIDWRCGNRDFARFANRSRVTLTLPRHFSLGGAAQAIGSTPPPRLFETALAGGFQIIVSPEAETADYYEPGREILTCGTDAEAVAAVEAMRQDPAARMAMATRARARTRGEHLYSHRIDEMLARALGAPRPSRGRPRPNTKKVVLFVSHNRLGQLPGGGVEIYQDLVARHLEGVEVLFLYRTVKGGRSLLCLEGANVSRAVECPGMTSERLSDPRTEGLFAEILVQHRVDLVHFHHLLYLPMSLPLVARALGVPSLWQMHDYFLICDRYNLLTKDHRFCDVAARGGGQCDACLHAMDGRPPGSKARRDSFMARVAGAFDAILASTPWSGDYVARFYPEIERARIHVMELPATTAPAPARPRARDAARLRIAVPGNFTEVKGGDDLVDVMRLCADYAIDFEVFGRVQDSLKKRLSALDRRRVTLHNGYDHDRIVGLLAGCDLSLHLSIWPETYMLSLSEAWAAGLVPIVSGLGAPGERVEDGVDGFTVPPNDPGAAFALILRLFFDRDLLRRMGEAVARKRPVALADHAAALQALYDGLIDAKPCRHGLVPDQLRSTQPLSLFDCGIRLNAPHWSSRDSLWDGEEEPAHGGGGRPDYAAVRTLSERERRLPLAVLEAADAGDRMDVDRLEIDGRAMPRSSRTVAFHDLVIEGWALGGEDFEPRRTYLRLRSSEGATILLMDSVNRGDLAGAASQRETTKAGYRGAVDLGALPEGPYAVDLLQPGKDVMLVCRDITRVTVMKPDRRGRYETPKWTHRLLSDAAPPAEAERGAPAFRLERQNLDRVQDVMVGRAGDVWWIEGEASGVGDGAEAAWALLQDETRPETAYQAPVHVEHPAASRGGPTRLRVVGSLEGVPEGAYRLRLATTRDGAMAFVETGLRLFLSPAPGRFAWSPAPPPALSAPLKDAPFRGSIDACGFAAGLHSLADGRVLMCRGWGFASSLGAPRGAVLRWEQRGAAWFGLCEPVARGDVLADIGEADASHTGFECGLPVEAFETGAIRFFHCYDQAVVEWSGFDALVRESFAVAARDEGEGRPA